MKVWSDNKTGAYCILEGDVFVIYYKDKRREYPASVYPVFGPDMIDIDETQRIFLEEMEEK